MGGETKGKRAMIQVNKIYNCYGSLNVKVHNEDTFYEWKELIGSVYTKLGVVTVNSEITKEYIPNQSKKLLTAVSCVANGKEYSKIFTHYKACTKTGLARIANKFIKECFDIK